MQYENVRVFVAGMVFECSNVIVDVKTYEERTAKGKFIKTLGYSKYYKCLTENKGNHIANLCRRLPDGTTVAMIMTTTGKELLTSTVAQMNFNGSDNKQEQFVLIVNHGYTQDITHAPEFGEG